MSGTDIAYAGTRNHARRSGSVYRATRCYAMSGTDRIFCYQAKSGGESSMTWHVCETKEDFAEQCLRI
eukprot:983385-Rhodomonas_salina.2